MSRMEEQRNPADAAEIAGLEGHLAALASSAREAQDFLLRLASALFPDGPADRARVTWADRRVGAEAASDHDSPARADARLRAAEVRYRTLVEQIPAVTFMAVLGEGENEVYVSPHIETLLGFSQKEWLENPFLWYRQLHADDRDLWNEEFARGCRTGGPFKAECRFIARDGHVVWVRGEARVVKDDIGRPLFLQGVALDITESKRAEALLLRDAVRTTEERYRDLVHGLGAVVWEAEPVPFEFTLVSRRAEELLGFAPERWMREPAFWPSRIHADDRDAVTAHWQAAIHEGAHHAFEYRAWAADGRLVWLQDNVRVIRDGEGHARHLLGVMLDVTERKNTEQDNARLYEAAEKARRTAEEANRAKDDFLATMSHELRTPLNSVLGWVRMLRAGQVAPEEMSHAFEVIERNARAQVQLVEDIMDVSRIITGKLRLDVKPVDLAFVIDAAADVVRLAAQAKHIDLQLDIDPAVASLNGDSSRLQQVVWNLLTNAVKFTPPGGRVVLRLDRAESKARITVTDTGVGIASEFLPHVFDRFRQADSSSTRRHGGLGLGLAIVRHIVEQHGGEVRVASPGPGQGATFTVEIPLSRSAPTAAESTDAPAVSNNGALRGVRILLVDDEPDARELTTAVLRVSGADVIAVGSAREALRAVASTAPDVLVSDIGMPGEDGYRLIRELRARGYQVPAIALTAYGRPDDREHAFSAGFQVHLAKPADPREFATVILTLLGKTA
jgi:PAS domain S-box-containing protein